MIRRDHLPQNMEASQCSFLQQGNLTGLGLPWGRQKTYEYKKARILFPTGDGLEGLLPGLVMVCSFMRASVGVSPLSHSYITRRDPRYPAGAQEIWFYLPTLEGT